MVNLAEERRNEQRVDIRLKLRIEHVQANRVALYMGALKELRAKFLRQITFMTETERAQVLLRRMRVQQPDLSLYLETLEKRMALASEGAFGVDLNAIEAQEVNLSQSGLRLHSRTPLTPDEMLLLRVFAPMLSTGFLCLAKVVYTQPPVSQSGEHACQAALTFIEPSDSDQRAIRQLLDNAVLDQSAARAL